MSNARISDQISLATSADTSSKVITSLLSGDKLNINEEVLSCRTNNSVEADITYL